MIWAYQKLHFHTILIYLRGLFFHKRQFLLIRFKYTDRNDQEIVIVREFGLESLWSSIGGFVGIFVGTSLYQQPSAMHWSWLYYCIKSNNTKK